MLGIIYSCVGDSQCSIFMAELGWERIGGVTGHTLCNERLLTSWPFRELELCLPLRQCRLG